MRYRLHFNQLKILLIVGLGIVTGYFIFLYVWNDSEGVRSYSEYLTAIDRPYQNLYENLQSLPENPAKTEILDIYAEFEKDINEVKVSNSAEIKVLENYKQLLDLPEIFREDYEMSSYKYSTLIGQTNHAKMMTDFINQETSKEESR